MSNLIYINEKGFVLPLGLMFLAIITILGTTAVILTTTDLKIGSNYKSSVQTFYLAEAGINHAQGFLKQNISDWNNYTVSQTLLSSTLTTGNYTITIEDPNPASGNNRRKIVSTAITSTGASAKIEVLLDPQYFSPFSYAAFGDECVDISGNNAYVDSYNSSVLPWTGEGNLQNGDVGTNSLYADDLDIGNGSIYGDAIVGAGGDPDTVISSGPKGIITGSETVLSEPFPMSSVTDPGHETSVGILSSTQTISVDTRVDSISLASKTTITISGDVTLYVDGDIHISGQAVIVIPAGSSLTIYASGRIHMAGQGIVNGNARPENLIIYGTDDCSNVHFSGQADLYGAIYAPKADCDSSGQADIFGSIIGNTVDISGQGSIHYDENLNNLGNDTVTNFNVISWKNL